MGAEFQFDEKAARRIEATYRTPDVVAQRREVLQALALRPGERVLDIGSGPGLLACEMGAAVGPSGRILGIDASESMLAMARARCPAQPWVTFEPGEATRLPVSDGEFDVAVSTQVYEYVRDIDAALAELYRVLRPGGRALILDTDWDSIVWHSTDHARMERVLAAWEEHLADPRLPRRLAPELRAAGFRLQRRTVIPLFNPEYDPDSYSYFGIGLIESFVRGRRGITEAEAAAWAEDLRRLGEAGSYFFSLNRYLFLALRPDGRDRPAATL